MVDIENRKCSSCKCMLPTEQHFEKNRKGDYFKSCTPCRVKARVQSKIYREANKEKVALAKKKCYEKKKEYYVNATKIWVEENKEKRTAYLERTKEHNSKKHHEYCKDKRHLCKDHAVSRANCKICNPNGHLKALVTARIKAALKSNKSKQSIEYLGCDIQTFRGHLEKSFKTGMAWENQGGDDGWDIDHIIPVFYEQDGLKPSTEEVIKRLHYTNCQAMWHIENIKKGNRYIGDYIHSESESSSSD